MPRIDPLQAAAAAYAADHWTDEHDWRRFGRETGTSDILSGHPRLYRSLSFGDDDYPDAALAVLGQVLEEATEEGSGEAGRMELIADAMPDLPGWIESNSPPRTKRLFKEYLTARDASEIPEHWSTGDTGETMSSHSPTPVFGDLQLPDAPSPSLTPSPAPTTSAEQLGTAATTPKRQQEPHRSIFIVHGHDEAALNSIQIYVHNVTGTVPNSLADEAGRGQTIIEKFENSTRTSSYVIVLLTPDDVGQTVGDHQAEKTPAPRARQNVVLELGYFIGKIGRENVTVIDAGVEHPSDLAGLNYVKYPGENWKDNLRIELEAAGLRHDPDGATPF